MRDELIQLLGVMAASPTCPVNASARKRLRELLGVPEFAREDVWVAAVRDALDDAPDTDTTSPAP